MVVVSESGIARERRDFNIPGITKYSFMTHFVDEIRFCLAFHAQVVKGACEANLEYIY